VSAFEDGVLERFVGRLRDSRAAHEQVLANIAGRVDIKQVA
jgi:hypothetical protein